jgi:hypothetical protein
MAAKTRIDEAQDVELSATEARQGGRPRAMLWVLIVSMALAIIVGLALWLEWISLPS